MARGEQVNVDVCGVYNRYHANGARAFYVGEPPADVMDFHNKSSGVFDVIRDMLRPNLPVAELVTRIRAYYDEVGIWSEAGWVGGYELGIGFPPDWVGNFVYEMSDTGEVIEGKFPPRTQRLILEWHALHKDELSEDWALAQKRKPLKKINPLE
jgi:hypothetical protein